MAPSPEQSSRTMSSSSSSSFSDEDTEALALSAAAPSTSGLSKLTKLAQICSFCATFRTPLRLPSFSRTELQEALLGASNGDTKHMELLAELHFKLTREHPTAKMEKIIQDWEKSLARKLQENWRKEFSANPMGGGVTYQDLTVFDRVNILDALCHWKLDTCAEIHKYIAMLQQDNNHESMKSLRVRDIGTDDNGVSYWYFGDECWVYAEDKPRWQLEERKSSYLVEFANAKRIRLSINFDPDHNSTALPLRLSYKSAGFFDEAIKHENKKVKEEVFLGIVSDSKQTALDTKLKDDAFSAERVRLENERLTAKLVKIEKEEIPSSSVVEAVDVLTERNNATVKVIAAATPVCTKADVGICCVSREKGNVKHSGASSAGLLLPTGSVRKQHSERFSEADDAAHVDLAQVSSAKSSAISTILPLHSAKAQDHCETLPDQKDTKARLGEKSEFAEGRRSSLPEKADRDNSGNYTQPCLVAIVGAKKRTIIDDDSSSSDADFSKAVAGKNANCEVSFAPPWKKHKANITTTDSATGLNAASTKGGSTTLRNTKVNGMAASTAFNNDFDTPRIKETLTSLSKVDPAAFDLKESRSMRLDVRKPAAIYMKEPSSLSSQNDENDVVVTRKSTEARLTSNVIERANPLDGTSMSPTDPAAAPETFDITCENCKKCYDMRYLDPPLVERPSDEWRCFECLVNDARGWPRRRKPIAREPLTPRAHNRVEHSSYRKRSSLLKPPSKSLSLTKSQNSSKCRSSSASKKRSSHSSSSKRKSSISKRSSNRKSSSSSSRKHKKRKSSSSHHRHGSSHSHHRRRHSHHYHEEFAKLVKLFRDRQEQRLGFEEARTNGNVLVAFDEGPQGWRIASSTLDELQALIRSLSGGSLEQDRLKGRLILIAKDHEKLEEQRRKQHEQAWDILPRRQSSRIAIGRMKNQSAQDSDTEEGRFGDEVASKHSCLRSKRRYSASDGVDDKQKHDRAWRARRRHNDSDDTMHLDKEANDVDSSDTGNWIDWSVFKANGRCLATVCLAVVNRLLQEEASDLFSRPVDPEIDGCPNYLSVIRHPMDLGTIRLRAETNYYRRWKLFKKDIELVWQNCRTFNAPDTMVVQFANLLERLSRSMCIAAEKKGADRWKSKGRGDDEGDESENSLSDASRAESRSSVNKLWTESSGPESCDSSDDDGSPHVDSDSNTRSRKRSPTRTFAKNVQRRARSTRSSGISGRTTRSTRSRSSTNCQSPSSSSDESSALDDDDGFSSVQKSRRQLRRLSPKADRKVDSPTNDEEDSVDNDSANNQPPLPQNGAAPSSPLPQVVQKRPKPRLVISDSSNSDDSSDSDDSTSSSSSSDDSVDSDGDTYLANKHLQPPPPSSADAPAPPPPFPPPPATLPEHDKAVQSLSTHNAKSEYAAGQAKTTETESTGKTGCTHSPPLLNSYLSPSSSSSSSSDISSGDSGSSDDDDSDST